ncbi:hypothetical protein [Helicobacter aurati]|uniref:hypothetical protein n=1 Tax=Helicobacter aurati TaxID=137778 RepID=UPI000CF1B472|nr:hypothetical protein [Helicobacter aurati]
MCGILGTLPSSEPTKFAQALNTLSHRGPDNQGVFHDNSISLGHTRLSILDLSSDASQPMHFPVLSIKDNLRVHSDNTFSAQDKTTGGGGERQDKHIKRIPLKSQTKREIHYDTL